MADTELAGCQPFVLHRVVNSAVNCMADIFVIQSAIQTPSCIASVTVWVVHQRGACAQPSNISETCEPAWCLDTFGCEWYLRIHVHRL